MTDLFCRLYLFLLLTCLLFAVVLFGYLWLRVLFVGGWLLSCWWFLRFLLVLNFFAGVWLGVLLIL